MALFDLRESYGSEAEGAPPPPTFKTQVAVDIDEVFFNGNEHADWHNVDGKDVLVVIVEGGLREHSSHWEAGAKQNFDTGLYTARSVLYIRVKDYIHYRRSRGLHRRGRAFILRQVPYAKRSILFKRNRPMVRA